MITAAGPANVMIVEVGRRRFGVVGRSGGPDSVRLDPAFPATPTLLELPPCT